MKALLLLALVFYGAQGREEWWQNGNFYQIYPRSFKDSDGDGIGDLNGISQQLEYLKDLGMDGVWLSPIFKSPMVDFGYDISDYYTIQPEYGSTEDLGNLLKKAHELGLRLILDFVPNHTSDENIWFQRSVNGDPHYRDFYVWHDGVVNATTGERQPPSNWLSQFRYSAWEWNEQRQQYYLHQFSVKQPELNYRNPAVVQATKNVMRYWLGKGVDGFRIDAVPFLFEVEVDSTTGTYPDEPVIEDVSSCPDPDDWCHLQHIYTNSQPEAIDMVYQWRELVDDWKNTQQTDTKILLTEAYTSFNNLMLMYGNGVRNGSHVPFNFEMLADLNSRSSAADFKYYVEHWLNNMPEGVYANWVLGNHDNRRLASRFGAKRTDLMNIFLQTLPGIAVTYNGEEYGQLDVDVSWEDTVDPQGCSASPDTYESYTRDPARTPFRWNSSPNAGFSKAQRTWLPVGENYENDNVAKQLSANNSHLKIFKKLIQLRKNEPAFDQGGFEAKVIDNVLFYERAAESGEAFIIILNIGNADVELSLPQLFSHVGSEVQVEVSSLESDLENGALIDSNKFLAKAFMGYVVRVIEAN